MLTKKQISDLTLAIGRVNLAVSHLPLGDPRTDKFHTEFDAIGIPDLLDPRTITSRDGMRTIAALNRLQAVLRPAPTASLTATAVVTPPVEEPVTFTSAPASTSGYDPDETEEERALRMATARRKAAEAATAKELSELKSSVSNLAALTLTLKEGNDALQKNNDVLTEALKKQHAETKELRLQLGIIGARPVAVASAPVNIEVNEAQVEAAVGNRMAKAIRDSLGSLVTVTTEPEENTLRTLAVPKVDNGYLIEETKEKMLMAAIAKSRTHHRAENVILTGPTGCIAGEAMIGINRCGKSFELPISEVVRRFQGGLTGGRAWDLSEPTLVRTRGEDGFIRLLPLRAVQFSGHKEVYRVRTESGHSVRATADHEFSTSSGWKRLDQLSIGALIHVEGKRPPANRKAWKKNNYATVNGLKLHPYAARRGVNPDKGGWSVTTHRLVMEASLNGIPFNEFVQQCKPGGDTTGLKFLDPRIWVVHHEDEDPTNNNLSNLQVLSFQSHERMHALMGGWKNVAIPTVLSPIVEIRADGLADTFDLSLDDPHNFLADGVVVHNCGKTSLVEQLCAKLGIPMLMMSCQNLREVRDWFGYKTIEGGTMRWRRSQFEMAISGGNVVVVLDELNRATAYVTNGLMPLLDHRREVLIEELGEMVKVGPGVVFVGTINEGGQYVGTHAMDLAGKGRFPIRIECDYLSEAQEIEVVIKKTGLKRGMAKRLVQFAHAVRQKASSLDGAGLTGTVSTRQLLAAAEYLHAGGTATLEYTIVNHFDGTGGVTSERSQVVAMLEGKFPELKGGKVEEEETGEEKPATGIAAI